MILYDSGDWLGVVFSAAGTVWPSIKVKFMLMSLYAVGAYIFASVFSFNFGTEGRTILTGTLSFLLIFRANQAYVRYTVGRTALGDFFTHVRELVIQSMGYVRGGAYTSTFLFHGGPGIAPKSKVPEDIFDARAREVRVDIIRLSIALCVAMKLHTRIALDGYCFGSISAETKWLIDWDRLRLRQLLTWEEFRVMNKCVGIVEEEPHSNTDPLEALIAQFKQHLQKDDADPPAHWADEFKVNTAAYPRPMVVIAFFCREAILRGMNDSTNNQPWGIKERFVAPLMQLLALTRQQFEMVNQIITTPLPLPYANLCKMLLTIFLFSIPFFIDYRLGWFANTVIPSVISLALLGIDAIATELENPFGDDDNDIDILELMSTLEFEAVELLKLTGDIEGFKRFCWRPVPEFIGKTSFRKIRYHLAVRDVADVKELLGHDEWNREVNVDAVIKWRSGGNAGYRSEFNDPFTGAS